MLRMRSGLLAARCSRVELELLVSPCSDTSTVLRGSCSSTTEAAPHGNAPLQSALTVGTALWRQRCCRALTRSPNTPMRMGFTSPTSGRVLKLLSGDLHRGDRQGRMAKSSRVCSC